MKNRLKNIITKSVLFLSNNKQFVLKQDSSRILFVMGMFRSGTSLTTQVMADLGFKLSPNWMLHHSRGKLKDLNPNGFYEDFLFAHLARFWVYKMEKKGSDPPSQQDVENYRFQAIKIKEFISFCEYISKEDRVTFFNRHKIYLLLIFKADKLFFNPSRELIKIPMLLPFYNQIVEWLPNSSFLIVIRNPDSTIKSSKVLTKVSDIDLYNKYYQHLKDLYNKYENKCIVFSYDELLKHPEFSIKSLAEAYDKNFNLDLIRLIDEELIRNKKEVELQSELYDFLLSKAINIRIND